jgi:hypothetical protein
MAKVVSSHITTKDLVQPSQPQHYHRFASKSVVVVVHCLSTTNKPVQCALLPDWKNHPLVLIVIVVVVVPTILSTETKQQQQ